MNPMLTEQLVVFAVALLAGALLWSIGALILRTAIALAGLVLGAMIGWLTWVEIGGAFPLWTMLVGFALVIGCVGFLIYRLLLAGLLATIFSTACFITLWSILATTPQDAATDATTTPPAPLVEFGHLLIGTGQHDDAPATAASTTNDTASTGQGLDELLPAAVRQADAVRLELAQRTELLWSEWKLLEPGMQLSIVGSVVGGLLLGLLVATFARRTSAVIVTAVGGSILFIVSCSRLLGMAGAPMHQLTDSWVLLPVVLLAALSIAGMFVQMTLLRRRSAQEPDAS